ncbi:hypothetical protein JTB14_010304 [Gonioctena quinquepunctata]|nr:hypothetical protein JTB14_010304 [Gonioctena quinquepunctata]
MFLFGSSEKNLSNPSISCPVIKHDCLPQNSQSTISQDNSRHSNICIIRNESLHNGRGKVLRNIFTKLRSQSSEEFQSLLGVSLESIKVPPIQNDLFSCCHVNTIFLNLENRNKEGGDEEENLSNQKKRSPKRRYYLDQNGALPDKTKVSKDRKKTSPDNNSISSNDCSSSEENNDTNEIKVCLPLDFEEFGEEKTIKLVICGGKQNSDNISGEAGEKSSSCECLASTLSKNPQIENQPCGSISDSAKKKKGKTSYFSSRFPTRLSSSFPFFKRKHKNSQTNAVPCCADKCEQTCSIRKIDTVVEAKEFVQTENKACCFTGYLKPRTEKKSSPQCKCLRCGKLDVNKTIPGYTGCNCSREDTWKLMLKMESKQNYRQVKHILREIKEQREEIRDLHRRYTSLLRLHIGRNAEIGSSEKLIGALNNVLREKLTLPADHDHDYNMKQIKNAINRSTVAKDANTGTSENRGIDKSTAKASELSLFPGKIRPIETADVKVGKSDESIEKDDPSEKEKDSCICLSPKISESSKCTIFWRKLLGKKTTRCTKQCGCRATTSIEKCWHLLGAKVKDCIFGSKKGKLELKP